MKVISTPVLRHAALVIGLAAAMGTAQADDIFQATGTMLGGAQFASYSFEISDVGVDYTASLLDYAFPASFDFLSLAITQGSDLLGMVQGSGSFTFSPAEIGTYTALVFGDPGGMFDAGSYGISVADVASTTAVPEPETWALLLTGLGLVGMAVRRQEPKTKLVSALG